LDLGKVNDMADLRLADEVFNAAKHISLHEEADVEVSLADGSRLLFVKGEDLTPTWWATAMPRMQPGQPPSELDLTPTKVRLGRWHREAEEFISSRALLIPEFLNHYKASRSAV
jgi:hypothetical protein